MDKKQSSTVIPMKGTDSDAADLSAGSRIRLPSAVAILRDQACGQLLDLVKQVFVKVDDSLFSMAERAHGQEEQDGLFQALRLLRMERRNSTEIFSANIGDAFQVNSGEANSNELLGAENLSLVHNDDLEQLVAIDTMVANAKRESAEQLTELCLRLDTLYSCKIFEKNNPLGPDSICDAFVEALRPLDLHIRARLTLLKKFEQVVMLQLNAFYESSNKLLIDQGVLPGLRQQQREAKQGNVRQSPAPTQSSPSSAPGGSVHGQPAGGAMAGQPAGTVSGSFAPGLLPATAGLAPMPATDLLTHLGALQLHASPSAESPALLDVGSLLQQRLVQSNQSASLAKVDRDIIKLVEMLFSFILDDRNLAEPIKNQLGRLQLPLLKVAIADKTFFSKGGHPARKLLNELADAATGWQAGEQYQNDPLFREVNEIVDQVLSDFNDDIAIFDRLLGDLRGFIAREKKRADMLERRIVDEADGRAKTQAARARVAAVMEALVRERDLPQVVHDWLQKVWNNALFLTCVKEGTDSDAWSRSVRTARDLVWSVQAPMPENQQQLLRLLPALQKRLREAVQLVSLSPFEARRLFADLKQIYHERFELAQRANAERQAAAAAAELQQSVAEEVSVSEAPTEIATSEAVVEDAAVPDIQELQEAAAAAEVGADAQVAVEESISEDDPHWQQTYRLSQGNWFEFKRSEQEQFRCRLAAVIRDIDQFIFVNRNGAKVAEFSRLEVALALRAMQLLPLDDGMLFERALQSVIGNVRKSKWEQR